MEVSPQFGVLRDTRYSKVVAPWIAIMWGFIGTVAGLILTITSEHGERLIFSIVTAISCIIWFLGWRANKNQEKILSSPASMSGFLVYNDKITWGDYLTNIVVLGSIINADRKVSQLSAINETVVSRQEKRDFIFTIALGPDFEMKKLGVSGFALNEGDDVLVTIGGVGLHIIHPGGARFAGKADLFDDLNGLSDLLSDLEYPYLKVRLVVFHRVLPSGLMQGLIGHPAALDITARIAHHKIKTLIEKSYNSKRGGNLNTFVEQYGWDLVIA